MKKLKLSRRKWSYNTGAIALAARMPIHTVRDHRQSGRLDPSDLLSVASYVISNRLTGGYYEENDSFRKAESKERVD